MQLGKLPARPDAIKFKFNQFFKETELPTPPETNWWKRDGFDGWQLFNNDIIGNCVWAGAAHETMQWAYENDRVVDFTTENVNSDYSAVTGYNPNDPFSDGGTDMQQACSYRRKTGIIDSAGIRHRVDAYVALKVGDFEQLKQAMYLFGGVGIGFWFPESAMEQFESNKPVWSVVPGSREWGGHYVPGFGINWRGNIICVSWGRLVEMTPEFYEKYSDEAVAYLDVGRLRNSLSPDGFHYDKLKEYLLALK